MRISDWSSDVCSSDLQPLACPFYRRLRDEIRIAPLPPVGIEQAKPGLYGVIRIEHQVRNLVIGASGPRLDRRIGNHNIGPIDLLRPPQYVHGVGLCARLEHPSPEDRKSVV